jgi:hypothetical protein
MYNGVATTRRFAVDRSVDALGYFALVSLGYADYVQVPLSASAGVWKLNCTALYTRFDRDEHQRDMLCRIELRRYLTSDRSIGAPSELLSHAQVTIQLTDGPITHRRARPAGRKQ